MSAIMACGWYGLVGGKTSMSGLFTELPMSSLLYIGVVGCAIMCHSLAIYLLEHTGSCRPFFGKTFSLLSVLRDFGENVLQELILPCGPGKSKYQIL